MGNTRSRDCEVGEDNQFCDDTSQYVLQRAKDQPQRSIYFHQSIEKKTNKSHGKKSVVGRPHYPFEMAPFVR